jgi:hypothetical protein
MAVKPQSPTTVKPTAPQAQRVAVKSASLPVTGQGTTVLLMTAAALIAGGLAVSRVARARG